MIPLVRCASESVGRSGGHPAATRGDTTQSMTEKRHDTDELEQAMAEALASVERREAEGATDGTGEGAETSQAAPSADQDLREQLLRLAADFDNYRKRTRREIEAAEARGMERLLHELLPVFDDLERAVAHADTDPAGLADGIRLVHKHLHEALARVGVGSYESVGEAFDPEWHEAITQTPTDAYPPGSVAAELKKGYRIGERLLRPAQVVVAEPKGETRDKNGA